MNRSILAAVFIGWTLIGGVPSNTLAAEIKSTAADAAGDHFGWSVVTSDDTAIVGAAHDAGNYSGSAYIFTSSSGAGTYPPDGLVGAYLFNGNADDSSGNGNHGTLYGATTPIADRFGNANSAYRFSSNNDYIDVPGMALISTSFTISAWVKISTPGSSWLRRGNHANYILASANSPTNPFALNFTYSSNPPPNYGPNDITVDNSIILDEWMLTTGVYDKDQGLTKLYLNCALIGDNPAALDPHDPGGALQIGSWYLTRVPNGYPAFIGDIDDVLIYNRALTDLEIQGLCPQTSIISISIIPTSVNFGTVTRSAGSPTPITVDIANTGTTGPLTGACQLTNKSPASGNALSADLDPLSLDLATGAKSTVSFSCDDMATPASHTADYACTGTNADGGDPASVPVSCTIEAPPSAVFEATPTPLNLEPSTVGAPASTVTLTLHNTVSAGGRDVTSLSCALQNSNAITVTVAPAVSIAPGASTTAMLSCNTASPDTFENTYRCNYDLDDEAGLDSTTDIMVSCTVEAVGENLPPYLSKHLKEYTTSVGEYLRIDVTPHFADKEDDELTFSLGPGPSSDHSSGSYYLEGGDIAGLIVGTTLHADLTKSPIKMTLTAIDTHGNESVGESIIIGSIRVSQKIFHQRTKQLDYEWMKAGLIHPLSMGPRAFNTQVARWAKGG